MESSDIFTNQSFEASEAFVRDWRSRKLFLTSVSERDEKPATLRIVAYGEGLGKKGSRGLRLFPTAECLIHSLNLTKGGLVNNKAILSQIMCCTLDENDLADL